MHRSYSCVVCMQTFAKQTVVCVGLCLCLQLRSPQRPLKMLYTRQLSEVCGLYVCTYVVLVCVGATFRIEL